MAVDIHRRSCGCVKLVPQWFHASAEIGEGTKIYTWCGVFTADLVFDFVKEDTNKLKLEDVLGGVAVGAALTTGELPESKIVAVLLVGVALC